MWAPMTLLSRDGPEEFIEMGKIPVGGDFVTELLPETIDRVQGGVIGW